jgi:FkbM family methyltransferase
MSTSLRRILSHRLPRPLVGWCAYHFGRGKRAYGQFAEDVLLERLITRSKGYYVDIGAFHPKFGSNTYFLWKRGWHGINVDVDDYKIALFRRFRPADVNLAVGISSKNTEMTFYYQNGGTYGSMSSFDEQFARSRAEKMGRSTGSRRVPVRTLNWLLENHLPRRDNGSYIDVDFLNIDVEGHEYEILNALDFDRFRPLCLCVEIHASGIDELQDRPTYQLLQSHGYQMAAWSAPSCIFTAPLRMPAVPRKESSHPVNAMRRTA